MQSLAEMTRPNIKKLEITCLVVYYTSMTKLQREFVGLFWGEGSIVFMPRQSSKNNSKHGYRLSFQIHMRNDDFPMLDQLQKEFGGKIYHKKGRLRYISKGTKISNPLIENPSCYWIIFRKEECLRVLSILEQSVLQSSKIKQLRLARQLIEIEPISGKSKFGSRYSDEQIAEQQRLKDELTSLRVFKVK